MVDLDILEKCIERGRNAGASYVEARLISGNARSLFAQQGNLVSAGESPYEGIGIRTLYNGSMVFTSVDRLNKENIMRAIDTAIKMAKSAGRKTPISLGEPVSNVDKWAVRTKIKFPDVDYDTFIGFIKEFTDAVTNIEQPTLLANHACALTVENYKKYLYTSEGTKLECDYSQLSGFGIITAKSPSGSEQRFHDFKGTGGWEWFKEKKFFEDLTQDTHQVTQIADKAQSMTFTEPIDMVVGQEVAGVISHENVGHPSEGDRIMGREAAQAGESYWKHYIKNIGKEIVGSPHVSVSDDPTIEGSPGYYRYDDEGVPARKRRLIVEGRLNEPLLNREYGERYKMKSNGAARADGFAREPIIRMASTYIEPGDHTLEEMVAEVKKGIYMKSFTEWNIDDRREFSRYVGLEAYLIENGEITSKRVKRPVFDITSLQLFMSIAACGKTVDWNHYGTCGKGDPMQGAPVIMAGPEVLIKNIKLL